MLPTLTGAGNARDPSPAASAAPSPAAVDRLVRKHTAATSLADLVEPGGGYRPTLYATTGLRGVRNSRRELTALANAYDAAQAAAGDPRRAHRV